MHIIYIYIYIYIYNMHSYNIYTDANPPLIICQQDVTKALLSFPRGSAGGPDCLRSQHLIDMTSKSAGEGGELLIQALTKFVNFVLSGNVIQDVRPTFFGASLIALKKNGGGIRPIAISCTLRRLVAKVGCKSVAYSHHYNIHNRLKQL